MKARVEEAMSEDLQFLKSITVGLGHGLWGLMKRIMGGRYALFLYDFLAMRYTSSLRHRQLVYNELVCRFCDNPINLMGRWRCKCGITQHGNYFGRCTNCLGHPTHIDCEACGSSMDVR